VLGIMKRELVIVLLLIAGVSLLLEASVACCSHPHTTCQQLTIARAATALCTLVLRSALATVHEAEGDGGSEVGGKAAWDAVRPRPVGRPTITGAWQRHGHVCLV
jgi:hypothetical protein